MSDLDGYVCACGQPIPAIQAEEMVTEHVLRIRVSSGLVTQDIFISRIGNMASSSQFARNEAVKFIEGWKELHSACMDWEVDLA